MLSAIKVILILSVVIGIAKHHTVEAKDITNSRGEVIQLDPNLTPAQNFKLTQWSLSLPVDTNEDGAADNVPENYVAEGLTINPLFYTGEDGGMVFYSPANGPTTSKKTLYTRTELREMLREGDTSIKVRDISKNNWVLSTSRSAVRKKSGGVDGTLDATLAVNHVTTTGNIKKLGRVVIGQIHATSNEPLKIYYHKLPTNTHGSIYIAHESLEKDKQWFELIGSRKSTATNPEDGIALDEVFSYRVAVIGDLLTVTIIRAGKPGVVQEIDLSTSGYKRADQYMYFKAGVYNQNNTADENDYVQATFYQLENTHK